MRCSPFLTLGWPLPPLTEETVFELSSLPVVSLELLFKCCLRPGRGSVAEHLASRCKAQGSIPRTARTGLGVLPLPFDLGSLFWSCDRTRFLNTHTLGFHLLRPQCGVLLSPGRRVLGDSSAVSSVVS